MAGDESVPFHPRGASTDAFLPNLFSVQETGVWGARVRLSCFLPEGQSELPRGGERLSRSKAHAVPQNICCKASGKHQVASLFVVCVFFFYSIVSEKTIIVTVGNQLFKRNALLGRDILPSAVSIAQEVWASRQVLFKLPRFLTGRMEKGRVELALV